MSITVNIQHQTRYQYDRYIQLAPQTLRLHPSAHSKTIIKKYALNVEPAEHYINWHHDVFNNKIAYLHIPNKTKDFCLTVDIIVELNIIDPFDFRLDHDVVNYPFTYSESIQDSLQAFFNKQSCPELNNWIKPWHEFKGSTVELLVDINTKLFEQIDYTIRLEPGIQACEQTLATRTGSCRDMAWLLCQALRHLGFASRFTSGYLIQLKPDEYLNEQQCKLDQDEVELHAWTDVYLPGAGWIGLDPSSGLLTAEGHIPLCSSPAPNLCAPISGNIEQCDANIDYHMSIHRLQESPRETQPYTQQQWQAIDNCAHTVEQIMENNNLQLTIGGEPTFISEQDYQSAQWRTDALGDDKYTKALELFKCLQQQFAANGICHYGHGKQYPGESAPRWAMHCYWRKDQQIIWQHNHLLNDVQICDDENIGNHFLEKLCTLLAINSQAIISAHNDKTNSIEGHILPLHWSLRRKAWLSCQWPSNSIKVADSDIALGLKLPLDTLPNDIEDPDLEFIPEHSQFDFDQQLSTREQYVEKLQKNKPLSHFSKGMISTALCVQVRHGKCHVFIPPIMHLEQYLELITAIELVAYNLQQTIVLEGYCPPINSRLSHFSVTPDPGVIEVNIHPARNWQQLKHMAFTLFQQAKQLELGTVKYQLDGKAIATGGGSHITLGAQKPANSPFLKRPDLLASLICFWQHHPSLSYLFSGQFIGPTSQAPRIDEARHDSMYELEIAFKQLPRDNPDNYWLVDRLLRNLLVDVTGNTHRAEICIDKLYSPDREDGRLGLVELRAFEMPPHPQMYCVQNLLVKSLISCFWEKPVEHKFIPWGNQLHDHCLLPHFLWQDLQQVVEYIVAHGIPMDLAWFDVFKAFRFPLLGEAEIENITLQLHSAIEPWPVLGESSAENGTSRPVDSSLQRIQVTLSHFDPQRYVVACNGYQVPLYPTNEQGQYVAGIRYKAWPGTQVLHPTMPLHTPLCINIIDKQQLIVIGGVKYYSSHPDGKNFDKYPINAREAAARQGALFSTIASTDDQVIIKPYHNPSFPHTLDLRYTA